MLTCVGEPKVASRLSQHEGIIRAACYRPARCNQTFLSGPSVLTVKSLELQLLLQLRHITGKGVCL